MTAALFDWDDDILGDDFDGVSGGGIDSRAWTGLEPTWWEQQGVGATRADHWADCWEGWKADKIDRLKALAMLWGPPVPCRPANIRKGWTVYDGHVAARGEDWTFGRAILSTIGILLGRRWRQVDVDRDEVRCRRLRAETGKVHFRDAGFDMGHWDYRTTYGGWACMCLDLHRGCRVDIFSDGDSSL